MEKSMNIKNNDGSSAITFALILPLLLLIVFAVIEFGLYFTKDLIVLNAINAISSEIQSDPLNPIIGDRALEAGGGFMSFNVSPNHFCAKAYATYDEAKAGSCSSGWETAKPEEAEGTAVYYIALSAKAKKFKLALSDYLPDIKRTSIVRIGSGSSMIEGFPDSLICYTGTTRYAFYLFNHNASTNEVYYSLSGQSQVGLYFNYNDGGSYKKFFNQLGNFGPEHYDCSSQAKSIETLYDEGQAFDLVR